MLRKIIHIVLLLCIYATGRGYAQITSPNWMIASGTDQKEFFINPAMIAVDGDTVRVGDYLGAFVPTDSLDICVGSLQLTNIDTIQSLFAVFNMDSIANTPQLGDLVTFKHWSLTKQCEYNEVITNLSVSQLTLSNDTVSVGTLTSQPLSSPYAYDSLYINEGQSVVPNIVSSDTALKVSFTEISQSFLLDTLTGEFDLTLVPAGNYEIEVNSSEICLKNNQFIVEIVEPVVDQNEEVIYFSPDSDNPEFRKIEITSEDGNKIEVFDKSGRLIISSSETFSWDGKDKYGNLVPADDYYIKIGDQMTIVTVIQ